MVSPFPPLLVCYEWSVPLVLCVFILRLKNVPHVYYFSGTVPQEFQHLSENNLLKAFPHFCNRVYKSLTCSGGARCVITLEHIIQALRDVLLGVRSSEELRRGSPKGPHRWNTQKTQLGKIVMSRTSVFSAALAVIYMLKITWIQCIIIKQLQPGPNTVMQRTSYCANTKSKTRAILCWSICTIHHNINLEVFCFWFSSLLSCMYVWAGRAWIAPSEESECRSIVMILLLAVSAQKDDQARISAPRQANMWTAN